MTVGDAVFCEVCMLTSEIVGISGPHIGTHFRSPSLKWYESLKLDDITNFRLECGHLLTRYRYADGSEEWVSE